MIAVFVRQQHTIELSRGDPALLEPDHDLPRTQSAIDQNPAMICRDQRAIPRAAAAEHGQCEHASISSGRRRVSQIGNGNPGKNACHPEAGEARRGISQALNRFREMFRVYVMTASARRLRATSCNCEVPRRLRGSG
jgi:hypothetical protein